VYFQAIQVLPSFSANQLGVKVGYKAFRRSSKVGKESSHLLDDISSQVLEWVDVCYSGISVSKQEPIMYNT